jgi:hypothetical protein
VGCVWDDGNEEFFGIREGSKIEDLSGVGVWGEEVATPKLLEDELWSVACLKMTKQIILLQYHYVNL